MDIGERKDQTDGHAHKQTERQAKQKHKKTSWY